MTKGKMKNVYLDIETYYSETKPSLEDVSVPANYKNPETILKYQEENVDKQWMKTALDPINGRIFCVGLAVEDALPVVLHGKNEKETLNMLSDYLTDLDYFKIIAHNGLSFDFPFIFLRSVKHGNKYLRGVFSGKDHTEFIDTMRMADGTSWKTMYSLDKLCKLIGIEGKGDISGGDVPRLILEGRGNEVLPYCADDVVKLRQVYIALGGSV